MSETIPRPVDDGLAAHLLGSTVPADLALVSASDTPVKLSELPGLTIVFCYPRTGAPGEAGPDEWKNMPGARGCTAEASSYCDSDSKLTELGANAVVGLSVQGTA